MKNLNLCLLFLFFVVFNYSQTFDTNITNINSQFQTILKEISLGKSNIPLEIDGSTYFFKKPTLLNINTNRLYWHSGAGKDSDNIFDRYKYELKKIRSGKLS